MYDNKFEAFPGLRHEKSGERELVEGEGDFESAMKTGVPEFAGEQFGVASEVNNYYGETMGASEDGEEFNEDISNAANIINYGLNAASRELSVEQVVQRINDFDPTGSGDPIGDLYEHLGITTAEDRKDVKEEAAVAAPAETEFRESVNAPATMNKSVEGAFKAIADMKALVADVEGADPRYEELRSKARLAGMGYFEYAVKDFGVQGLVELFQVLSEQKKKAEEEEEKEGVKEEEMREEEKTGKAEMMNGEEEIARVEEAVEEEEEGEEEKEKEEELEKEGKLKKTEGVETVEMGEAVEEKEIEEVEGVEKKETVKMSGVKEEELDEEVKRYAA